MLALCSIDTSAALAVEGVEAVITGRRYSGAHSRPVLRAGVPRPAHSGLEKVRHIGEPVAVVFAADPHVAEEAADLIAVEYEPLEPVFDEVEATQPGAPIIHDVLKPAGMFTDLKHLKGRSGTNVALDSRVRHGDVEKGFAEADQIFEHTFRSGKVIHATLEPITAHGRTDRAEPADDPHHVAEPVIRARRGQPAAGLAGESPAGAHRVSGRRLRRQALHQAGGARGRLRAARAQAGADRADDGRAVLHDHQARRDRANEDRREQGRPHRRARGRDLVERRRLRRHRAARHAEIRLYRRRSLRHRECEARQLRRLHQ